jgi:hypothetical protein
MAFKSEVLKRLAPRIRMIGVDAIRRIAGLKRIERYTDQSIRQPYGAKVKRSKALATAAIWGLAGVRAGYGGRESESFGNCATPTLT